MPNDSMRHDFDLDGSAEELDLFAEELPNSQHHDLPPNSLSTLACECDISTFFCYGCGALKEIPSEVDNLPDFESSLKWTREKMNARLENDKAAEVIQTLFRSVRGPEKK